MKNYLKINEKMIIREEDKMLFSARNMKIYKFNEKAFEVIKIINNEKTIARDKLFLLLSKNYTQQEFNHLIDKMLNNNIIVQYE